MTVRSIQVGLGKWGTDWAKNVFPKVEGIEFVGFVDAHQATLDAYKTAFDLPFGQCFPNLEEAFATVEADAVVATVAVTAHVAVAQAALNAGKHVLLEKPFAPALDEAIQTVDIAERVGRTLMISQNYRFYPAAQEAARIVREGTLGKVGAVNIDFRRHIPPGADETDPYLNMPHPLLVDMAIHHFDLMRFILGQEPVDIACKAWNPPWRSPRGSMSAAALISFDRGAVVSYRGSWGSTGLKTPWAGEWHIECERGELIWTGRGNGLDDERVRIRGLDGSERNIELSKPVLYGRAASLTAFVHAVTTGTVPPASGKENLGSVALMNAACTSAETNERHIFRAKS